MSSSYDMTAHKDLFLTFWIVCSSNKRFLLTHDYFFSLYLEPLCVCSITHSFMYMLLIFFSVACQSYSRLIISSMFVWNKKQCTNDEQYCRVESDLMQQYINKRGIYEATLCFSIITRNIITSHCPKPSRIPYTCSTYYIYWRISSSKELNSLIICSPWRDGKILNLIVRQFGICT